MGQRREHQMEWGDEHGSRLVRNWVSPSPGKPFFLNVPSVGRFLAPYGEPIGGGDVIATELYDHLNDPGETRNLAGRERWRETEHRLDRALDSAGAPKSTATLWLRPDPAGRPLGKCRGAV